MWEMRRFTICYGCERYTQTTRERICRKCWDKAAKNFLRWLMDGVW